MLRGQAPGNSWDHKRCLKTAILLAPWVVLNRVPTPSDSWRVPKLVPGHHALSMGSLSFSKPPSWNNESTNLDILQVFSLRASLLPPPPIQGTNQSFCCCCRSSEELTDEQHRAGGEGKAASSLNCCLFIEGSRRNLRNDLLVAADSITNTMSSLVKELNSGAFGGPVPCGFVVEGRLCSESLLETCS